MSDDEIKGADSQTLPPTRLNPPAAGAVAAAGNRHAIRDRSTGRFTRQADRIDDSKNPWDGSIIFHPAEGVDEEIQELHDSQERRRKRQIFVRNACIALAIFIVVYFAAQLLRLAV